MRVNRGNTPSKGGSRFWFSRKRAHAGARATVDLELVDRFRGHRRIVLRDGRQGFVPIDVAFANELAGFWVNPPEIARLQKGRVEKKGGSGGESKSLDVFLWRTTVAHLYTSHCIPIYEAPRGSVDKIDVFAAGSCGAERCHRAEIAKTKIALMGRGA